MAKMDNYVNQAFLDSRAEKAKALGYSVPRYVTFCNVMLNMGLAVHLHEAKTTVSKYVVVHRKRSEETYKVRFSNHKPNKGRELEEDCDFFVGVTHTGMRTTDDAIIAVKKWLEEKT